MKKILLVSLVMLLTVSVAFSQFGIKAGVNLGTAGGADKAINPAFFDHSLNGLPNVEPKANIGLTGGISYRIGLILGLAIQPEVLYTQKGTIYEMTLPAAFGGGTGKGTFNLNYIDIPVLVKFSLPIIPVVSPYIEGGIAYSILLSAKLKGETPAGSNETDIKDMMTKNDFSLMFGVGIEFLIFEINARYVIGQTKIIKDLDWKIYNRGIMLTAGLRF
jgi:opacity protein-like surface antigen